MEGVSGRYRNNNIYYVVNKVIGIFKVPNNTEKSKKLQYQYNRLLIFTEMLSSDVYHVMEFRQDTGNHFAIPRISDEVLEVRRRREPRIQCREYEYGDIGRCGTSFFARDTAAPDWIQ